VGSPVKASVADRAQYLAVRGLIGALERAGFDRAGAIGASIGEWGYAPLGVRRGVVESQIAAAFPEWTEAEVHRVARASYASLARTSVETAVLPTKSRGEILDLFEGVDGWDGVESRLARGRGLILVGGHIGNWELAGAALAARGLMLDVVARHMANKLFDRYLARTREQLGMRVVFDEEAVRRVPRTLRSGGVVAFLVDQAALGLASTWVPFFGRDAKTPRGPAVFSLRLQTPIVFGAAIRTPSNRYRLVLEPVDVDTTGDRESDVDRIVAAYTAVLERWVRRVPEQYFWQHRRWKHARPTASPEISK
jgi:KDO2-lipid IV(A) lauroyltransferase